jgi:hypothetical protein
MSKEKVKKPFYKKWWVWLLAVIIIGVIFTPGEEETATTEPEADEVKATETTTPVEEPKKEEVEPKEEKPVELTPQEKMLAGIGGLLDSKKAFDTGSYIKGDIPAGEYAFITFDGSGEYYVEKDSAGEIIDNENFSSFGYVTVLESGNLQTDGVLINVSAIPELGVDGAKEVYEILNNVQDHKETGYYKVGVDIPAGTYTLESTDDGYVAIMTGPVGKNDIVDNEIFNGRYQVVVSDGQYLNISGAKISE